MKLNDFAKAYAGITFEKGPLRLATEFNAKEGDFDGYVEPVFENMSIFNREHDSENPISFVWQAIIVGHTHLIRNHPTDRSARACRYTGVSIVPIRPFSPRSSTSSATPSSKPSKAGCRTKSCQRSRTIRGRQFVRKRLSSGGQRRASRVLRALSGFPGPRRKKPPSAPHHGCAYRARSARKSAQPKLFRVLKASG